METGPNRQLPAVLHDALRQESQVTFRRFMEIALYDPAEGYYAAGRARIGRHGDFFTNVSVGPLFGKLIARQVIQAWHTMGKPVPFTFVEQGAHRGEFCRDLLNALSDIDPSCFTACQVVLVEPTDAQRQMQAQTLAPWSAKVHWAPSLAELGPFTGIHFSNELIDAFPVHLVQWNGQQWQELYVTKSGTGLELCPGALSDPALAPRLALITTPLPEGYTTEINLMAFQWMDQLAAALQSGYALAVDYGYPRDIYYAAHRTTGTLSAYQAHQRVENPLETPGQIDLTAHVDFTSVTEHALALGFNLAGFCDQHHFMVGLGALHFQDQDNPTPEYAAELRAFKTLMHPTLMGTSFKVLGLAKNAPANLAGFAFSSNARSVLGL